MARSGPSPKMISAVMKGYVVTVFGIKQMVLRRYLVTVSRNSTRAVAFSWSKSQC
jgi:hypothetical protein